MWLSKQTKPAPPTTDADLGITTIEGGSAGVITRGEVRALPVYGPGGYIWLPRQGSEVLVVKGGPGGEEQCVAGTRLPEAPADLKPGEIYIKGAGDGSICLRENGTLELRGKVSIEGRLFVNGEPYQPCTCEGGGL